MNLFQFRHKGVPLVRASGPLVPGRRSNDDEKAVAAVLGGRKRGFILDVQVPDGSESASSVVMMVSPVDSVAMMVF